MASFYWKQYVDQGCPFCGTSVHDRGFVDCIADTVVRNPEGEVTGVVDIFICASCVEQISRMVGCLDKAGVEELVLEVVSLREAEEKLKDEAKSWEQRYYQLIDNLSDDLGAFVKEQKNGHSKRTTTRSTSSKSGS